MEGAASERERERERERGDGGRDAKSPPNTPLLPLPPGEGDTSGSVLPSQARQTEIEDAKKKTDSNTHRL
jgi:hypothetical protein